MGPVGRLDLGGSIWLRKMVDCGNNRNFGRGINGNFLGFFRSCVVIMESICESGGGGKD